MRQLGPGASRSWPISWMKHLHRRRLIAWAWCEEAAELLARLVLGGGALRGLQIVGPTLSGYDGGEVGKLLRLERQELVAGLCRLQGTRSRLAGRDQRRHLGAIGVDVPG